MIENSEFSSYKDEAKKKWGKTVAYREHEEKTKDYSEAKWSGLAVQMDEIFAQFALNVKREPSCAEVQKLVETLQDHISENYYHCTNEILYGLGQMYVADERFRNNIDRHGEGTALFVSQAIEVFCGK